MNVRISPSHNYYILVSSIKFNVIHTLLEQFSLLSFPAKGLTQMALKAVKMLLPMKTRLLMAVILHYSQMETANLLDLPGLLDHLHPLPADPLQ